MIQKSALYCSIALLPLLFQACTGEGPLCPKDGCESVVRVVRLGKRSSPESTRVLGEGGTASSREIVVRLKRKASGQELGRANVDELGLARFEGLDEASLFHEGGTDTGGPAGVIACVGEDSGEFCYEYLPYWECTLETVPENDPGPLCVEPLLIPGETSPGGNIPVPANAYELLKQNGVLSLGVRGFMVFGRLEDGARPIESIEVRANLKAGQADELAGREIILQDLTNPSNVYNYSHRLTRGAITVELGPSEKLPDGRFQLAVREEGGRHTPFQNRIASEINVCIGENGQLYVCFESAVSPNLTLQLDIVGDGGTARP